MKPLAHDGINLEKQLIFELKDTTVKLWFNWQNGTWVCYMSNDFMEDLEGELKCDS